jgi:hypothetical protein
MSGGIDARLAAIRAVIRSAASRADRDPDRIRLVAVSKTRSAAEIRDAADAGQIDFGENYPQELAAKREALADLPHLRWHLIGHLQRNKVKLAVPGIHLLHTIDSVRLAETLDRHLEPLGTVQDVLIQVNIGLEPQKSGIDPGEAPALVAAVRALPRLRLRGLMVIPPFDPDPEVSRPYFSGLRELAERLDLGPDASELSMGMSDSLVAAVEEGATLVRVGTAIFGDRG